MKPPCTVCVLLSDYAADAVVLVQDSPVCVTRGRAMFLLSNTFLCLHGAYRLYGIVPRFSNMTKKV